MSDHSKIGPTHLQRAAVVYIRQSSAAQVEHNRKSTARQYALADRAVALGWARDQVIVIDQDLGLSGASAAQRSGFVQLTTEVALGHVGMVLGLEVSRLAEGNNVTPCVLHLTPDQTVSGLAINANALFASELGNVLAERSGTFGAIWHLGGDGEAKVSLRANNRINVAKIAEHYGGGGHPNAAGMRLSLEGFRQTLRYKNT